MTKLYEELEKIPFSKNLYIAGLRALNILDMENATGDWHTYEAWHPDSQLKPRHIMGDRSPAWFNTIPFLGHIGIFEASEILSRMGVPKFADQVYAAEHRCTIADSVIAEAFTAKPFNGTKLFRFMQLTDFDDFMSDPEDKQKVYDLLEIALDKLPKAESEHVSTWLNLAMSKNYDE